MAIYDFLQSMKSMLTGDEQGSPLSRRDMLSGIGLVGALATAGSTLLVPSSAGAAEIVDDQDESDAEITEVGYRRGRRRRRRGQRLSRRRLHGRRRRTARRRPHLHRRRFAYGDVYHRCANDWHFRRRNPGLCSRVLGMRRPRRGACVSMSAPGLAFSICG